MNGKFEFAIRYQVFVTCRTPLRTGGRDRDTQSILLRQDGTPFLQGTSLAGALRGWKVNEKLFGSRDAEGSVVVSDLNFSENSKVSIRPRLHINGKTGAAADGAKFDIMHLQTGTTGTFDLTWCGNKEDAAAVKEQLEEYLSALNNGLICLGGQKSNGFGKIAVDAVRREYDMKRSADREAWMNDRMDPFVQVKLKAVKDDRIKIHVEMKTDSLLVKGSVADGVGERSVKAVQIRENGSCVIPGSSLKGSIRAQAERIAPYMNMDGSDIQTLFCRESCGSDNGIAGKVTFADAAFTNPEIVRKPRIRINRLTGGTMRQALFTEEVIGGICKWDITIPQEQKRGALLIVYALRDLGIGLYTLGSEAAVGFGRASWLRAEIKVSGKIAVMECIRKKVTVRDDNSILAGWKQTGGDEK